MKLRLVFFEKSINFSLFLYILSIFLFSDRAGMSIYSNIIALVLFVFIFIYIILFKKKVKINALLISQFTFILFCFFSMVYSLDFKVSLTKNITLTLIFMLMILLYNYFDSLEKIIRFIKSFIYVGLLIGIYLLLISTTKYSYDARFGQELGNVNTIGVALSISSVLCFSFLLKYKKFSYLIIFGIITFCILLTGSRKALFFLIFNIIFILFLLNKDNLNKIVKFVFLGFLVISIFLILIFNVEYFYQFVGKRVEWFFTFFSDSGYKENSMNVRSQMIEFGFKKFLDKPLFGYGIDNYRILLGQKYGIETYSHNNYIELLVGTGILGFLIYYFTQFMVFLNLLNVSLKNNFDNILIYSLMSIIVAFFFLSWSMVYYDNKWVALILVISIATVSVKKNKIIN